MSSHSTKIVDSIRVIKFSSSIVIFAKNFHNYAIITKKFFFEIFFFEINIFYESLNIFENNEIVIFNSNSVFFDFLNVVNNKIRRNFDHYLKFRFKQVFFVDFLINLIVLFKISFINSYEFKIYKQIIIDVYYKIK